MPPSLDEAIIIVVPKQMKEPKGTGFLQANLTPKYRTKISGKNFGT